MAGLEDVYGYQPPVQDPMQSPDAMQALMARAAAAERLAKGVRSPDRANTTIDQTLAEVLVPQNAAELTMMALPGGAIARAGGKIGGKTLAALMGLAGAGSYSDEAEAGPLGKLVKKLLPMDEASRMGRATEQGYDTPVFHATGRDFSEFKPSPYRGASFFSATPEGAMTGAAAGRGEGLGGGPTTHIMPTMVRSQDIEGLNLTPTERKWWKALPQKLDEVEVDKTLAGRPSNIDHWWRVYDEAQLPDGTFQYIKKPLPSTTLEEVNRTGIDVYGRQVAHYNKGSEKWASQNAAKEGMGGYLLNDEAGVSLALTDPTKVRSKFAAFDPANIGKSGLLGSSAGLAALMGLGATDQAQAAQ